MMAGRFTKRCFGTLAALALTLVSACTPPIRYNGVAYSTPDAALAAFQEKRENQGSGLPVEEDPIMGRVRILVPDYYRMIPLVRSRLIKGNPAPVLITTAAKMETILARGLANDLVRTRAFETATVEEVNDTSTNDFAGADYLVAYVVMSMRADNSGPWVAEWVVRRAGKPKMRLATLDPGTPEGIPRIESFIKSVRKAALALGGKMAVFAPPADTVPAAPPADAEPDTPPTVRPRPPVGL